MFRKSIALILAVCFSLLCLTGCSNSTPSSSVSDAASIAIGDCALSTDLYSERFF